MTNIGIVIKSTGSWYSVKYDDKVIACKIKGKFRKEGLRTTNPIAVGDKVDFEFVNNEQTGVIVKIHERKNCIVRRSTNLSRKSHIIATNIDQAFLIVTIAYPKTLHGFIDRFLVSCEAYQIPVRLIFNKIDLYDDKQMKALDELQNTYENIGYKCFRTSATQQTGIETLRNAMKDKINVVSGNSGVGKSTLINAMDERYALKTAEISGFHEKGKHTTTFCEMFPLQFGGAVIDTPGIKGFGVVDKQNEIIAHYFPEMFGLLDQCQYYNCTHTHEPNCAVKQAIRDGNISLSRYESYIGILQDDEQQKYR